MIIVPSIDLRHGRVVRLLKGDYERQTTYEIAASDVATAYHAAGAQWMHVVDLDGAKEGRCVQADLIATLVKQTPLKVQVGGGVRTTADVDRLLAAGVERVVVGTAALEQWDWFADLAATPALAGRLVLALDARDGIVATRGWTASSGRAATEIAALVRGWSLGGILYTDVAVDGTLAGPSIDRTRELAEATDVPVIASGGVGSIDHLRTLRRLPIWGVIVGRALYEGRVDLKEAVALGR